MRWRAKGFSGALWTVLLLWHLFVPVGGAVPSFGASLPLKVGEAALEKLGKTYGDDVVRLLARYGDDLFRIAGRYGDEGMRFLAKYGDDGARLLVKYGDEGMRFFARYGDDGMRFLVRYGDDAVRLVLNFGDDVLRLSPRGVEALKRVAPIASPQVVRHLMVHGDEALALVARQGKPAAALVERALARGWSDAKVGNLLTVMEKSPFSMAAVLQKGEGGLRFLERNWKGILLAAGLTEGALLWKDVHGVLKEAIDMGRVGTVAAKETARTVVPLFAWIAGGAGAVFLLSWSAAKVYGHWRPWVKGKAAKTLRE